MAADGRVTRISVLGRESIVIGCGLRHTCGPVIHEVCKAAKYVVITDENVGPLYLEAVLKSMKEATGTEPIFKVLPPGESAKCRGVKAEIEDWMLSHRCGRDACMIALGGGVIGDLTGYVAATYMRGIKVVQIPTTLLAMVDSSIGGKTGIDTPTGKNLVGAFHHPMRIIMDLEVLQTLPLRQLCNGMAEVVKTALLWDADRFTELEQHVDDILAKDTKWLQSIVEGSAGIKAEVVTKDEKEGGLRTLLNVGHSIGHAVEAFLQPEMLHGEAVSIGTVKEAHLSRRLGYISEAEVGRITRCLQAFKLPVAVPTQLELAGLMAKMAVDKKNKGGKKYISLLERIGKCVNNVAIAVDDVDIEAVLAHSVEIVPLDTAALPAEKRSVTLCVPGSKSLSNRALLIAALGQGTCEVTGLLSSDDTQVMLEALQTMKACQFEWTKKGDTLVVTGNGGKLTAPEAGDEIYLGNAGTASRFLATAALLAKSPTVLTGNKRMKERPVAPLVTALRPQDGVDLTYLGKNEGCLPLRVDGGSAGLSGGAIELSADVSSQYVSSVLISAPYASKESVELRLTGGKVVSQSYIDMTMSIMRDFGVSPVRREGTDDYTIPRGAYANPAAYQVEADASSATYPLSIPAILSGVSGAPFSVTVKGIGSASVQGDAHFATEVLAKMGCQVEVGTHETTVTSTGARLKAIDIDMEPMTDAFMTAAVVMALAEGTSRITGVANQRVKECNRIEAMVTEFAKMGVVARELPDGLEIEGTTPDKLRPAAVHCYKDHRIAMSFAILGLRVPGVTILDTACVDKTYPVFWDHLTQIVGASIRPNDANADLQKSAAAGAGGSGGGSGGVVETSIILIGIRGAGKTTLGQHAARFLGWTFVDMDDVFEEKAGPVKAYIETHGWPAFRAKEAELLEETMRAHGKKAIIATGGGIVESEKARAVLNTLKTAGVPVVFIHKTLADTEAELANSGKPAWGEPVATVFNRRFPHFRRCSSHECRIFAEGGWGLVSRDFLRLVQHVTRPKAGPEELRRNMAFLSLTFDHVAKIVPLLPEVEAGADSLELRADLLAGIESPEAVELVTEQVSLLRRHSALPIIFTVRTASQGGRYPDARAADAVALLTQAARLGCEFIDVEMTLKQEVREELLEAIRPSYVLLSHHDPQRQLSWDALERKVVEASRSGADVVKIVTTAKDVDDCSRLRAAVTAANVPQPVIALAMGELGKLSRALNQVMTPITHPRMPVAAAPGQLSMASIVSLRKLLGVLPDTRDFRLFGSPVSASRSPLIHNTGFQALGLAPGWSYAAHETEDVEDVRRAVASPQFRGASVTIPLKERVGTLCASVSEAAKEIGAVNTLTREADGSVRGDNTDWIAMRDLVLHAAKEVPKVGVCIGAGGSARAACYALRRVGVSELLVWNRTHAKAEVLAKEFGGRAVTAEELKAVTADVVISNIPGATQEGSLPGFELGAQSVVIEMAYTPRVTVLLAKARAAGATCVEGIDVLIEQALHQFKIWTGMFLVVCRLPFFCQTLFSHAPQQQA